MKINQLCTAFAAAFFTIALPLHSQTMIQGARQAGISFASATLYDPYSIYVNPAGASEINSPQMGIHFLRFFSGSSLRAGNFQLIFPVKKAVSGGAISMIGNEFRKEIQLHTFVSHKIGETSLGIKGDYIQISTEGYGTKRYILFSFGGITKLSKDLFFGGSIYNINQAGTRRIEKLELPVILRSGLSYQPGKKLIINLDSEKQIRQHHSFKAGIEYSFTENFKGRTGVSTYPFMFSFGGGMDVKWIEINYAITTHHLLGKTHFLTIIWRKQSK